MRKKFMAVFLTAAAASCALIGGAPTASAAPSHTASVTAQAAETAPQPIFAEYHGREINLTEGWQGAQTCTELPGGSVRCFDTFAEADADTARFMASRAHSRDIAKYMAPKSTKKSAAALAGPDSCTPDYWCLYDGKNFTGRHLQFFDPGTKNLGSYDFRDTVSSIYRNVWKYPLNYGGARLIDSRSWPVSDRVIGFTDEEASYPDLSRLSYPGGGNWDNKADLVEIWRG